MRIVIDSLVALMLAAVLAAVIYFNQQGAEDDLAIEQTMTAVTQIQQQITLQAALGTVDLNNFGLPRTIDPEWFRLDLPRNELVEEGQPWLEVAGPRDRSLRHPKVRTIVDRNTAAFWYNPSNGVVRARVRADLSDESTLALYNKANGTAATSLWTQATNE